VPRIPGPTTLRNSRRLKGLRNAYVRRWPFASQIPDTERTGVACGEDSAASSAIHEVPAGVPLQRACVSRHCRTAFDTESTEFTEKGNCFGRIGREPGECVKLGRRCNASESILRGAQLLNCALDASTGAQFPKNLRSATCSLSLAARKDLREFSASSAHLGALSVTGSTRCQQNTNAGERSTPRPPHLSVKCSERCPQPPAMPAHAPTRNPAAYSTPSAVFASLIVPSCTIESARVSGITSTVMNSSASRAASPRVRSYARKR
jgi:hypothetical protein